ncbi:hypothetical protein LV164_005387 [Aspergillus fumigatus]|nr:hypothetical protein KXX42_007279 [Aspergillus fumigatus]KAH1550427.1 hypothetical protein KXX57_009499 [Aspergillus fumigatus]KAH1986671.1 hypothetical protein KXW88_006449 [Aspergillus fumigatus]KAH2312691.1 hypothetical protein KXV47_003677 [Aspergillus fumigatus]KAH2669047.1 hypothetical protein KXV32_004591 [Aspergillus fumigatus]
MPRFGRKRSQWPPPPMVEDEAISLSRELHGMSILGEKPGVEGVRARGTIDQYPVILDAPISESAKPKQYGLDECSREISSSDDSAGPATPPERFVQDPLIRVADDSQEFHLTAPTVPVTLPVKETRPQTKPRKEDRQPPRIFQDTSSSRQGTEPSQTIPKPQSRTGKTSIDVKATTQIPTRNPERVSVPVRNGQGSLGMPVEKTTSAAVPKRSGSVRDGRRQSPGETQQPRSSAGYVSASAANKAPMDPGNAHQEPPSQTSKRAHAVPSMVPPTRSGLAERLEEKLRQRQKVRESGSSSQPSELPLGRPTGPTEPSSSEPPRACRCNAPPETVPGATSRGTRSRALSTPAKPAPAAPRSDEVDPFPASLRTATLEPVPPVSSQSTTKRTVSFYGEQEHGQEREKSRSSRRQSPSKAVVRQPSPEEAGPCLLPCPRSVPVTGYQDWYTIKGLEHLDICPSCTKQMRNSRFQDLFIPSLPVPRGQMVRCSMSEPWTRLAWMQTIKKQYENLDMLQQITRPPPGSKPCTGRIISDQFWYRIIDPETGMYLPKFNVCAACIRNLRILMPQHRETFTRSATMQEQVCDFVADSPRFVQYIDLLDIAANRAELERSPRPDMTAFLAYARRKVVLRDCRRDRPVLGTWYYMPQLPEFTVCEDCYDDVVWPLVKANKPIARQFLTRMRLAPGDAPTRCREASCQLYSPRIRAKFRDAVQRNDLAYLKLIALKRYDVEQHIRERREELLEEESKGYDCDAELRKTLLEWRRWE